MSWRQRESPPEDVAPTGMFQRDGSGRQELGATNTEPKGGGDGRGLNATAGK